MFDTTEELLRQLEAQSEIINNQQTLVQQILSKFPIEVITKLEEYKWPASNQPVVPWTMKSLREPICQYVVIQENVYQVVTFLVEGSNLCQNTLQVVTNLMFLQVLLIGQMY